MGNTELTINEKKYFEMPGLNVFVYQNTFSEGHQGGIEIIQNGERTATNGELRLSASPGQWQPVPQIGEGFKRKGCSPMAVGLSSLEVDRDKNEICINCSYPNDDRNLKGFNPIIYPDLEINYKVTVTAHGKSFTVRVDMEKPVTDEWIGRVGYSLELFPGDLYGKAYFMDSVPGYFPRQANGPSYISSQGEAEAVPLAEGKKLVVAPESEQFRMTVESMTGNLQLIDGSLKHNNGWFIIHSLVEKGASNGAVEWEITPNAIPGWKYGSVIHTTQAGYHPGQKKLAFIELDQSSEMLKEVSLLLVNESGEKLEVLKKDPEIWGNYLRYKYSIFDFSRVKKTGLYTVKYGDHFSNVFRIDPDVYKRHIWQPTLEYFLPMQMCHMRINQKYRVWHGLCHMDDALLAPSEINHFDGYDTLGEDYTDLPFRSLEHIPDISEGGWHDAGDDDVRTDTQMNILFALAHSYEEFKVDYDQTFIDKANRHVEIHQPDGKPDLLQQIEHGVTWILKLYRKFGKLGMGIIVPTLRQYVHMGDPGVQTDNRVIDESLEDSAAAVKKGIWYKKVANRFSEIFDPEENLDMIEEVVPELDDRLLFMVENPARQLYVSAGLALISRVLKDYDKSLSDECLEAAEKLYAENCSTGNERTRQVAAYGTGDSYMSHKIHALAELIISTDRDEYKRELYELKNELMECFPHCGWALGGAVSFLDNDDFIKEAEDAAENYSRELDEKFSANPFGCPSIHTEVLGFRQYFLNKYWPEYFGIDPMISVMNFLLGCRPGQTVNSLVSGVGADSPTVCYGFNRADWSYIPGGTFWNSVNLVSPDFPEDKVWPYLWQEREYITDTACMFMFIVLAADDFLDRKEQ